jgi:outer membrane protein assembly factor BamB
MIYFGSMDSMFYAINKENGEPIWSVRTNAPIQSTAYDYEKAVYFKSGNSAFELNQKDGFEIWSYIEPDGGWISVEALVEKGILYIGGSDNHEMFAFDAITGEKRWTFEFLNNNFSKPLIYKVFTTGDANNVYGKGYGRGYLFALNKDDGTIHQFDQIGGNMYSNILLDNGTIYLGNEDGNIYALSLENFLKDSSSPVEKGYNAMEHIELSPNPFSDSLAIRFRLNREIEIGIQIKNIADEPLRTLDGGQSVSGENTIYWDGKDSSGKEVEDGYCFVELTAGSYAHKVLMRNQ